MKRLLKRSLAVVLGPALRWISRQLADIGARVDRVLASQDELLSLNRAALRDRDAGLELVSRSVAVQAASLETIAEEQRRLAEELHTLRTLVEAGPAAPEALEHTAPESGDGG